MINRRVCVPRLQIITSIGMMAVFVGVAFAVPARAQDDAASKINTISSGTNNNTGATPAPTPAVVTVPQGSSPVPPTTGGIQPVTPVTLLQPPTATTTTQTGSNTAPMNLESTSALPDGGDVTPRSPGLELPVDAGLAPGAPAAAVQQKSSEEIEAEIREDAFNAALTGLLPLEPPEIKKVIERYDQTQEAVETPIYPYPEPEVVVKNISLDPGVKPLEIKVATGHVTTVNFLDVSGSPWPIQDISWAGNFEILQPEDGGNVVRITPMSEFAYGNMSIRMVDLKTPVTFVLKTHRDGVYYRMDARLPSYGPMATPPIIDGGITIAAGNSAMTTILDGLPPQDAIKLDVTGVDGRTTAYRFDGMTYVRTPLSLLSPAWTGSVRSADGMNVYTLGNAPVLLFSENGRMVRARLTEEDVQQ